MSISTHSHKFALPGRIVYFLVGLSFTLLGIAFTFVFLSSLILGDSNVFSLLTSFVTAFSTLPFGLLFLSSSIFARVTIKPDVLEYHTPILIVSAKWKDLQRFEGQKSGKIYSVIVPTEGNVTLRTWAKNIHWLFRKDPTSFYIDTSQFSNTNGHSLDSDIISLLSSSE
jgi:hypothetical protein